MKSLFAVSLIFAATLAAQEPCPTTPIYGQCELVFELDAKEAAAHPNPYQTVQLQAEFRSPRHTTFLMPAFWDGANKMVIRFAPIDAGVWDYRISGNIARFSGKQGSFNATESDAPGFIRPANQHHWITTETRQPHLWMGDTLYPLASIERSLLETIAEARAKQKFTHIRGYANGKDPKESFPTADKPNPAFFQELDTRMKMLNGKKLIVDLILGHDQNQLAETFPTWQQREKYIRYIAARYSAFNVTWEISQEFEEYKTGRDIMKELGLLLKKYDPFNHPRTTHTVSTSAPLLPDGWMTHVLYQSSDDALGAIEHQLYGVPQVNSEFGYEDSGAGKTHPHHVDSDTFRKRLWNATMNGQYPTYGNTGTYGGGKFAVDAKYLESPGAKAMAGWYEFMSRTRYWDLEPYFYVDGGRCLALDDTEYIVYIEKPGPVEVLVQKHGYDITWFNPITGEFTKAKEWKGEKWTGEPPTKTQDWVLLISREGRKEGMLRSYKFESRPPMMQEVEQASLKIPYEIAAPTGDTISMKAPPKFAAKLKKETRGTRSMTYLWTAEAAADGQGYRVIGSGPEGTFQFRPGIALNFPAVLNVRLTGMNANGKVYQTDKVFRLTE